MSASTSFDGSGSPTSPHASPSLTARERMKSFSQGDLRQVGRGHLVPNIPLSPTVEKSDPYRLIIVANRLNVTAKRRDDGKYTFTQSSGGLASGLAGVQKSTKCLYYGWPGMDVPPDEQAEVTRRAVEEYNGTPIYLPDQLKDLYYDGFSNTILWALFHYHPEGILFDDRTWNAYKEANQLFAKTVAQDVQDGDVVWLHDYHLMLCPAMLRSELSKRKEKPKNVKIGWFLHTPFPSSEIYRVLPVREEILEGLLQADLLGFQTIEYVRHFLNSCTKVLDLVTTPAGVYYQGKFIAVQDFPIGIDVERFTEGVKTAEVIKVIDQYKKRFEGVKVILGVDRLDYIKGVQQKMHAFEVFLAEHPEWIGKVILIQVAVPTRGDVEEYQNLRSTVNELVGRINGKHGTIEFTPIHFLHQSVAMDPYLMALYAASDVCVVTSTRDGMNLVSYEYIACQAGRHGVLVLSEFAGAAQSFNDALTVNPWDTDMVSAALYEAVTMSDAQRKENYKKLQQRVSRYTSSWWGESFVSEITRISKSAAMLDLDGRKRQGSEESEAISSPSDFAVEVMTPSNFETSGLAISHLPELERCPKKREVGCGEFRQDEEEYNEKYAELHEEDEGIVMMAPERSPPPYAK